MSGDLAHGGMLTMAHRIMPRRGPRFAAIALSAVILVLILAGCGASSSTVTYGLGAGTITTPTAGHPGRTSIRPCTGPWASVNVAGTPALVLTPQTPDQTGTAHAGDLVQVRLPIAVHWNLQSASANMAVLQPAGFQDPQLNVCAWSFRARSAGDATLSFTGLPLCDQPSKPCPQFALAETFTVHVS